jgi:hypothetical protein
MLLTNNIIDPSRLKAITYLLIVKKTDSAFSYRDFNASFEKRSSLMSTKTSFIAIMISKGEKLIKVKRIPARGGNMEVGL